MAKKPRAVSGYDKTQAAHVRATCLLLAQAVGPTLRTMRHAAALDRDLQQLIERATARPMTAAERERQVASLAYGNAKLENDRITKPLVAQAMIDTAVPKR